MNNELIKFLQEKEAPGNWLKIAEKFDVPGTKKQKSDYVRRLWHKCRIEEKNPKLLKLKNLSNPTNTIVSSDSENGIHIILGCVHVPFHNKILLNKVLNLIQDQKDNIKGFHLIGDFLDLRSLAKQNESNVTMSDITLGKEYKSGNEVLDLIDSKLPKDIQKTFLFGNHEGRYYKYISDIKNYKTGDALDAPDKVLKLEDRGYKVYSNWAEDFFTIGKYQIFHGIYCTANPTKSHIDKLRHSCIFAHTHRIGQHFEGSLHGVNIGMLGDLNSETFQYLSRIERLNWKNGFGIINVANNISQAEVILCENDSFFYGGRKY